MNINLLKTFLEVARVRHFGKAAEKVCLTQSAVSARIKLVEDELGVKLFTRTRNDIQLTREGRRLARTAENIVKQWEQTKNELSLTRDEGQQLIRMGIVHDIWSVLPTDWLAGQRKQNRNLLFQVQAFSAPLLTERLLADEVDFAIMFDPPHQPGLDIIEIGEIRLHLISDRQLTIGGAIGQDYIYVDWGESFSGQHQQQLGDLLIPSMSMNMSSMARDYLLHHGGMAYLPEQQVKELIDQGIFHEVGSAPVFQRAIYFVHRKNHVLAETLASIRPSVN